LLIVFALTFGRDFPFSGDHYGHVGQLFRLGFWWLTPPATSLVRLPAPDEVLAILHHPARLIVSRAFAMILITTVTTFVYRRSRLVALGFATVTLVLWGMHEQSEMLRYPGGGYLAALPFLAPAFLLGEPDLAGRAANVAAPIVWLCLLRPWLVGRWPDWRTVCVGAFLFWHKDVIYYFDSVYLEPWAVVFALLAIEVTLERGPRGTPLACLLVGAAATIKEPFVLALPFVWLAGAPWRQPLPAILRSVGAGIAAGVPFVIYFIARKSVLAEVPGDARNLRFGIPHGDAAVYAHEFLHRVSVAFPIPSMLLLLAALTMMAITIIRDTARRLQVALLACAAAALMLLFVVENDSLAWIGYFRFLLPAIVFLTAGLFAIDDQGWRVVTIAVLALLLQAPGVVSAVALAAGPATRANFIENYDAPIFFPVKDLLSEARRRGWLEARQTVWANAPDTSLHAIPGLPVAFGPPGELACACTPDRPALLALFVRYANLAAPYVGQQPGRTAFGPPRDRFGLWQSGLAQRGACVVRLRLTCSHVLEHVEDGELVTILGVR
jgi:hypothetical protein